MAKKNGNVEERFIEIDEHNLEKEWVEQPKLYFRWAQKLATAQLLRDEAKANLDLTEADLDARIRTDPEEFGLEKVTEPAIKACLKAQEEYTNAQQEFHSAVHNVNILQAGVTALEHRKRALEKLVDLYGMNYFSSPRASNEDSREVLDNATKRSVRRGRKRGD